MSGLEFLRAILEGELPAPPIAALMGLRAEEVEEGRAVFSARPAEYHYNPIGTVHGGLAATLLDSALGCAVHSALPAGVGYTTVQLDVTFVRAMTADTGPVRAEARLTHLGGRIATAQGEVTDEEDRLYAQATTICMVFRPEV